MWYCFMQSMPNSNDRNQVCPKQNQWERGRSNLTDASKIHGYIILVITISMCSGPSTLCGTPSAPPSHGYIGIIMSAIARPNKYIRRGAVLATWAAAVT